jgi:squalene-associated FAD-dependent desaturase
MEIFYTFCRVADDIVDEPGDAESKQHALGAWRDIIHGYYAPDSADSDSQQGGALAGEMAAVVREYTIPQEPLLAILDGCAMDITPREYANGAELHQYCYGVASAVGLASIRIFGCRHPLSEDFAVAMGYALQFTNILRDVVEDYHELGRIYLPRDEMAAFGVEPAHLAAPAENPACRALFHVQYFRAKHYFNKARLLVAQEDCQALRAAFVMGAFYEAILEKIKASGFRLTRKRIRLSRWEKVKLLRSTLVPLHREGRGKVRRNENDDKASLVLRPKQIAVFGAGVAGIAAAAEVALAGHTVDLFESRREIGGRSGLLSLKDSAPMDNGHHAMFGCYSAFLRLVETLGVRGKLDEAACLNLPWRLPGGRAACLAAWLLPAPFHLIGALIGFSVLSWKDRWAILRLGLAMRAGKTPRADETAATWLARYGQTSGAIHALWEPFCIAALNEPLATGSASLLHETLRRTLFGRVRDSAVIRSRKPLGQLFVPEAALCLKAVGGALHLQARAAALDFQEGTVSAVQLADGTRVQADAYILAIPWHEAARLVPSMEKAPPGRPILSVHHFTSTPLMLAPLCGLLDSPVQWVFHEGASGGTQHYSLTLSCPGEWMVLGTAEIVSRTCEELARFFPESREVPFVKSVVCKYPGATFPATPEVAARRPGSRTAWGNLFFAGDWVATGLPATIESAARSGQDAAKLATTATRVRAHCRKEHRR